MYIIAHCSNSYLLSGFSCTGNVKHLLGGINLTWGSRYYNLIAIDALVGNSLSFNITGASYNPMFGIFYIGSYAHTDVTLVDWVYTTDTSTSKSISDKEDRILIGWSSGSTRTASLTTDLPDYYTNGTSLSCASAMRATGSASISTYGNGGGAAAVAEIQVHRPIV